MKKDNYVPHIELSAPQNDPVSHPSHYCEGRKYEPIDVFNDWGCFFSTGNGLKYCSRVGRKIKEKSKEDLEKALFYFRYELKHRSQPIIDSNRISIKIETLLNDWKLTKNISEAVFNTFQYITTGNTTFLEKAINNIEAEVEILDKTEKK